MPAFPRSLLAALALALGACGEPPAEPAVPGGSVGMESSAPGPEELRALPLDLVEGAREREAVLPGPLAEALPNASEPEGAKVEFRGPEPDPVEPGPAALWLRFVERETGEAAPGRAALWRLDAPGNEHWTDGDQLQRKVDVPAEGVWLQGLALGTYRVVPLHQRHPGELPEAFELTALATRRTIEVTRPSSNRVRILVLDRFGDPVQSGQLRRPRSSWVQIRETWTRARRPRGQEHWVIGVGGGSHQSHCRSRRSVAQPQDGFLSDAYVGPSRGRPVRTALGIEVGEDSSIRVDPAPTGGGEHRMFAVALLASEMEGRVRGPHGRCLAAKLETTGHARPLPASGLAGDWREAEVSVHASLEGYQETSVTWRPADGELPWIVMQVQE